MIIQKRYNLSVTPLRRVITLEAPEYVSDLEKIIDGMRDFLSEDEMPNTVYTRKFKDGSLEIELHESVFERNLLGIDIYGDRTWGIINIGMRKDGKPGILKSEKYD